ncbi:hypothetical protein [Bacillus weihaiensis]|uniref:Uncharacterized protein n=1 Tax=Bacillus weihaiensis TaxID=1547283 RepID=A0A1L3MRR6_9BACI|nr:hypothetical protein [Bacillus weihaiensis]APH05028.1 hypothetical protein A9C19_09855 [Bacillus weihaiensis]
MLTTLPNWFWAAYYLFLLVTLGTAVFHVVNKKRMRLSILIIVLIFTVPISSMINSIGREVGMNEVQHFFSQLQQGAAWTIFTIIGYLSFIIWWGFILFERNDKAIISD